MHLLNSVSRVDVEIDGKKLKVNLLKIRISNPTDVAGTEHSRREIQNPGSNLLDR